MKTYPLPESKLKKRKKTDISREQHSKQANIRQGKLWKVTQKVKVCRPGFHNFRYIYMKKFLDSDWLRAVQFKCNTSTKSVHRCKLHIAILNNDLLKDNGKFSKPMISSTETLKKVASREIFRHFLQVNFFMFILLISSHMVFSRSI